MKRLLAISIASASIAFGAILALAEVDPKIHKLCVEAKDYVGCVKAMKGESGRCICISPQRFQTSLGAHYLLKPLRV